MNNKILLSIAIPTYNRASYLEKLLNNIVVQARKLKGQVEICISNNCSTDNTHKVVMDFKEKYPGLIKYNENKENLGFDRNLLKAIEMSNGDFVWTFGDDDSIVENGLNEVINFIKKNQRKNIGLIIVRAESYFIDKQSGKKIVCDTGLDKNKPEIFKIDKKDIIGLCFPGIVFISAVLFNNKLVKEIFKQDKTIIERGIGTEHIQIVLYNLMFLKYSYINGIALNKKIVSQELPQYKLFIEDKFRLHYQVQKKLNNLLLSNKYMNDNYAGLIVQRGKGLRREFITDMMVMKAFKNFNYFSYFGCLKSFFRYSIFIDALLFSSVFTILFLIPSIILISLYKCLLMIKHGKEWKTKWILINNISSIVFKGSRRQDYWTD